MVVATLFKVTLQMDWQKEDDETSIWHCGSLDGARRFCQKMIDKGGVLWFSIEGQDFIPCDENDPDGQLYIRTTHFEFYELHKKTENRYWIYLEELRRSGVTNMFGATPYLMAKFGIKKEEAAEILVDWMNNYNRDDYN